MSVRGAAADWIVRINDSDATEADFNEWRAWLAQAPENREAYEALDHTWSRAAEVQRSLLPHTAFAGQGWSQRSFRRYALAATILIAVSAGLVYWVNFRSPVIETTTAEQRSVRLNDGSRVELAGESRLVVDLSESLRALRLEQGEVYFDVAQDAARPFVVSVGEHQIRAIGTAFNIEKSADRVVVTVTQGAVQIVGSGTSVDLKSGEQAQVSGGQVRMLAAAGNLQAATAWRDGRLEYLHEELRYVLDDVNRYVDRKIVVNDRALASLEFTGTVFLDHLDEWLVTLPGSFPVAVVERGKIRELVRKEE